MYMGIDPGKTGGIAILSPEGDVESVLNLRNMTEKDIFDYIFSFKDKIKIAYLEKVSSMPGQGVKSVWTFSGSYHGLRMALIGCGIKWTEVRPLAWQTKLKCRTKGDKNITKALAQQLFPQIKITHAIADSLLIAEYGRQDSLLKA